MDKQCLSYLSAAVTVKINVPAQEPCCGHCRFCVMDANFKFRKICMLYDEEVLYPEKQIAPFCALYDKLGG